MMGKLSMADDTGSSLLFEHATEEERGRGGQQRHHDVISTTGVMGKPPIAGDIGSSFLFKVRWGTKVGRVEEDKKGIRT